MNSKLIAGLLLLIYTLSFPQSIGVSQSVTDVPDKVVPITVSPEIRAQYKQLQQSIENLKNQRTIISIQETILDEKPKLEHR